MSPQQKIHTPRLLAGAALLFWGWQTGMPLFAAALALAVEAPRLLRLRLEIQPRDYGRFADLCVVLLLGQGLYLYLTPQEDSPLLTLGQWLPLTLAPLALAAALGGSGEVAIPAFFSSLRRRRSLQARRPLRLPALAIFVLAALFAAGCGNTRSPLFYPAAALLAGWWLLGLRPRRFPAWVWGVALLVTVMLGYAGQWGIHNAQEAVRHWVQRDPFKATTAVGQVGEVKMSGRIIFRVRPSWAVHGTLERPLLLREAVYDFFDGHYWHATEAGFDPLDPLPGSGGASWLLRDYAKPPAGGLGEPHSLEIFQFFRWRGALLHMPRGAQRIDDLPGQGLAQNRLGAVRVKRAPGLAAYTVQAVPGAPVDAPPTPVDRVAPPKERALLEAIVARLALDELSAKQKAERIRLYFMNNFTYSVQLERQRPDLSPLTEFLLHSRAGHCEYYAMAAVFLLRQAGIPARYALGHAVHEYDPDEQLFLVRERDAHTWALAWLDGGWQPLDATPPVWLEADAKGAGWLEAISDLQQRLAFSFARWRWLGQDAQTRRILLWTAGPLLVFLLVRLARSLRLRRRGKAAASMEFAKVEARLAKQKGPRAPAEPLEGYLRRTGATELLPALRLYYAARFDPQGLPPEDQRHMRALIDAWLRDRSSDS